MSCVGKKNIEAESLDNYVNGIKPRHVPTDSCIVFVIGVITLPISYVTCPQILNFIIANMEISTS